MTLFHLEMNVCDICGISEPGVYDDDRPLLLALSGEKPTGEDRVP